MTPDHTLLLDILAALNNPLAAQLAAVAAERARQDAKWGAVRDHDDGTGSAFAPAEVAARIACNEAFRNGTETWRHILTEEFYEALAESDPERLRAELIQVASVACCWAQAIARRTP